MKKVVEGESDSFKKSTSEYYWYNKLFYIMPAVMFIAIAVYYIIKNSLSWSSIVIIIVLLLIIFVIYKILNKKIGDTKSKIIMRGAFQRQLWKMARKN